MESAEQSLPFPNGLLPILGAVCSWCTVSILQCGADTTLTHNWYTKTS